MFGLDLPLVWFILIAFLFAGYFLLEGFDFGVGILLPFVGRSEAKRSAMLRTIGPVWDGNEVWLITAGGALFAAFPEWYASMFSGFYLPLFLILLGLIVRIVGLEWRTKVDTDYWRAWCDRGIILGSWLPPVLWGVAVANLIRGVPENAGLVYPLLNPFGLLGGLALTAVFVLHGLTFLRLKTAAELRERAGALLTPVAALALILGGAFAVAAQLFYGKEWTWVATGLAALGLLIGIVAALKGRDGIAFSATSLAVIAVTVLAFGAMFPMVWPGMDLWAAASSEYTLKFMTWSAILITPLVLVYQGWTYWVFRKRITAHTVSA